MWVFGWPPRFVSSGLLPPKASTTASAPRSTAETDFLRTRGVSVVAASSFVLPRNCFAVGTGKAGPLTITKSCVAMPSEPGRRSPSTPTTFTARPRGTEMLSSSRSPGLVEKRSTVG